MRKLVYISGPLSNGGKLSSDHQYKAVRVAMAAADQLIRAGFAPFCPHLTLFLHDLYPHPYETWIDVDLAWLEVADCVFRLPGESKGADKECSLAVDRDIPIYKNLKALVAEEG